MEELKNKLIECDMRMYMVIHTHLMLLAKNDPSHDLVEFVDDTISELCRVFGIDEDELDDEDTYSDFVYKLSRLDIPEWLFVFEMMVPFNINKVDGEIVSFSSHSWSLTRRIFVAADTAAEAIEKADTKRLAIYDDIYETEKAADELQ